MKVYNLACEPYDHRFEGWFGSEQDYLDQSARQLLSCPICSSLHIKKLLSAPRINLGRGNQTRGQQDDNISPASHPNLPAEIDSGSDKQIPQIPAVQVQAALMQLARKVIANTEDVGDSFAEEARRIHYDEAPARGIRGVVSREERMALQEEGIDVLALPMLDVLKESLQ